MERPTAHRYERTGLLCVDPRAFFELFMAMPGPRANQRIGTVEVIDVSGPLVQRDDGMWCDSYEALRRRFSEACASDARAIVMRIDSPGGDASGCFETARAIRAEADAARKPFYAYIDRACSAAYALASAAQGIAIGETCCAGSIGVLSTRSDCTQRNLMQGLRMAFITSGERKLDGNPDAPISEAELAATQQHVDELALKFFALIAEQRVQLPAATIAGFDGGVFYGDGAVRAGLADAVMTFEELLATASKGEAMTMLAKSEYESARAMLQKVAKGGDANATAAKRALAALAEAAPPVDDPEEEPEEEPEPGAEDPDGDEPATQAPPAAPPAAAGEPPAPAASTDPPPPAAATTTASTTSTELALAAKVHALEARMQARDEATERARLIGSRKDFGPELRAALQKAPLDTVRDMVRTLPKGKIQRKEPITTVAAAAGGDGGKNPSARSAVAHELDVRMGLVGQKLGCRREGSSLIFGVMPDEAAAAAPAPGRTNGAA